METYEKVYVIDAESINEETMNSLIMCGTSNWDFYFKKTDNTHSEVLENVKLIEFESEDKMFEYIKENNYDVIDYSLEHDKPCVLAY